MNQQEHLTRHVADHTIYHEHEQSPIRSDPYLVHILLSPWLHVGHSFADTLNNSIRSYGSKLISAQLSLAMDDNT